MGWKPEEGYYQRHVKTEGYSNKITEEQELFNSLSIDEISKAILIVSAELDRESKTFSYEETQTKLLDYVAEYALKKQNEGQDAIEEPESDEISHEEEIL